MHKVFLSLVFVSFPVTPVLFAKECTDLPANLKSCTPYTCHFIHPLTSQKMERNIQGEVGGKCVYTEQMPNNGKLECKFSQAQREVIAQFYKDSLSNKIESASFNAKSSLSKTEVVSKYTINGKEADNPLQEATNSGDCVISGY